MVGATCSNRRLARTADSQLGLATAILFGRCSQQPGATGNVELLQEIRQCQKCCHAACSDQVMTAGMSDPRQRIVLRIEADQVATAAACGFKRSLESICVASDGNALAFQEVADGIVSFVLLIG